MVGHLFGDWIRRGIRQELKKFDKICGWRWKNNEASDRYIGRKFNYVTSISKIVCIIKDTSMPNFEFRNLGG